MEDRTSAFNHGVGSDSLYPCSTLSSPADEIFSRVGELVKICSVSGNLAVGTGVLHLMYGVLIYPNVWDLGSGSFGFRI